MNVIRLSGTQPRHPSSEARLQPVRLAHEPPLKLGRITIDPAECKMRGAHGRVHVLEPRLMEVLVALARTPGRTVGRDELVDLCWDRKIVTDEAVASVIYRLRCQLREAAPGHIEIETVRKIGFRLIVTSLLSRDTRWPELVTKRRQLLVLIVPPLLLAVYMFVGAARESAATVVSVVGVDASATPFASGLASDLAGRGGKDLLRITEDGGSGAHFIIHVGHGLDTDLETRLLTSAGRNPLWTAAVSAKGRQAPDVRRHIVSEVLPAVRCIARGQRSQLQPELLKLYVSACARLDEGQLSREADDRRIELLKEITLRAPNFADAWAELAVAEASAAELSGGSVGESASMRAALRESAREHLQRARRLNPTLGAAFVAEAVLLPRADWRSRHQVLEGGLRMAPDEGRLLSLLSLTSQAIGRNEDAVRNARRAVELDPLSRAARSRLVSALMYAGHLSRSRAELKEAERIWPVSPTLADARFRLELRQGDPTRALTMLQTGGGAHPQQLFEAFLQARRHPTAANVEVVRRMIVKRYRDNAVYFRSDIQTLVQLGLIDEAFDLASRDEAVHALSDATDVLFRSYMKPMWLDGRFMDLAARLGLMRQWEISGLYPDFCRDPALTYDCQNEVSRYSKRTAA